MSVAITARVFWTVYPEIDYWEKNGRHVRISETSAKITMLAIGDSADDFGENSYNSFDTLATKTGLKRRSVIRVCRALINHRYLSVAGLSAYGTNNFKIHMDKLGDLPKRRARVGRPKTGDSVTETGDSVTETGDSTSPDSSLIRPVPSSEEIRKTIKAANETVDAILKSYGLAAGKSWTKLPEIYHPYGKVFCAGTGLTYTKSDLYKWMPVFETWEAKKHSPQHVLDAIQEIKNEGKAGQISGPSSITWKLEAMAVARNARQEKVAGEEEKKTIPPSWQKYYEEPQHDAATT